MCDSKPLVTSLILFFFLVAIASGEQNSDSLHSIHDIQGSAHISQLSGEYVENLSGIVTAISCNGFFMQDREIDSDNATSEGIFVYTSKGPTIRVGDSVLVEGNVSEFRDYSSGLSITEIVSSNSKVDVVSNDNVLPDPVIIGTGGRIPPGEVIEDDAHGSAEINNTFDIDEDGIDFYESLEGMLVQVNNPIVIGPADFDDSKCIIPVLSDCGRKADLRTSNGGIVLRQDDFNPEIIFVDFGPRDKPKINTGDRFVGPIIGVMDYSRGSFRIRAKDLPEILTGCLYPEVTDPADSDELAIATYNVHNLNPLAQDEVFNALAGQIVFNLQSPDIIALMEIQDNTGEENNGVVDANLTYEKLIGAIVDLGGPEYQFRDIDPENNKDGGAPGGNIRVGFLFRTDRGLNFMDRPGGDATAPVSLVSITDVLQLSFSPGRINPMNQSFISSRKPLVGEFSFDGHKIFIIANHLSSKSGDQPLYGKNQPPNRPSEDKRHKQAQVINDFVGEILENDPDANIVVLGDFNDFQFSETLNITKGNDLINVIESLEPDDQYTYIFDGNSQVLDHILVSEKINRTGFEADIAHINSEFADQASDHDPVLVRMRFS